MVNKELAEELRARGHSYLYIAEKLNCSVGWCKLNLKGADKHAAKNSAVNRLVEICKNKGFVTKLDLDFEVTKMIEECPSIRSKLKLEKLLLQKVKNILHIKPKKRGPSPPRSDHTGRYVVYSVTYKDDLLYVGSGAYGRERHACSGCSHLYELNRMHFNGEIPVVSIIKSFDTSEEALMYEQEVIRKSRPKLNQRNARQFSDDSVVVDLQDAS